MEPQQDEPWSQYRMLVIEELRRLSTSIGEVKGQVAALHQSDLANIRAEIAVLKFKAGVWGFASGAIPASVVAIYTLVHK